MKRIFTFLLIVFVYLTASAESVSEQQALQKAQQFMKGKQLATSPGKARVTSRLSKDTVAHGYYVFNTVESNGFVIIASDDRMPEVLGYSEHGCLDPATAPCNVKWLLEYYDNAAANIRQVGAKARTTKRAVKPDVRPLVTTTWDQGAPYNLMCPEYNGTQCITGCVATAMAQVINYHRWPVGETSGVPAYTTASAKISVPALAPTIIKWDNMTSDDIARLMRYCGQSVQMDYGLNDSGAMPNLEPAALRKVFGYDPMVQYVEHSRYNDEDWEDLLYNELSLKRPIVFNGFDGNGGHTFVVHGYREGLFYVNWGWSGKEDGYFAITGLNTSIGNFNSYQTATIGIQPPVDSNVTRPSLSVSYMDTNSDKYVARGENGDFPIVWAYGNLVSELDNKQTIKVGFGLYDDDGLIKVLWESEKEFSSGEEMWIGDGNFIIDKSISNGTYEIKFICQTQNSEEWLSVANSSSYYLEVVVSDKWLKTRMFPLSYDERYMEDLGAQTIDGITYNLYVLKGSNQATVVKSEHGVYDGELYVPNDVVYESVSYKVTKASISAFQGCPELTSLSIGMANAPVIWGCSKLTQLEFREGVVYVDQIGGCDKLESIDFPKSVSKLYNGVAWCSSLKTIRFKNQYSVTFEYVPEWDDNSLPKLKDIYFASTEVPHIQWKNGEMRTHSSATIHVPKGFKTDYEASDWKGWNIVDDQDVPDVEGVVWGYCEGNVVADYGVGTNYGQNDAEYAIHVPAEVLAPYKGMKISQIQFYQAWNSYDYVFITKPGVDYLTKETAPDIQLVWNKVSLSEPYTITGDELYVGIGRRGQISINWSDPEAVVADGFWSRAMGNDTSAGMEPGKWIDMAEQGYVNPIPLRFVISGENLPNDVAIKEIAVLFNGRNITSASGFTSGTKETKTDKKQYSIKGRIQNNSKEELKRVTINWDIDGSSKGSETIEMTLLPSRSTSFQFDINAAFTGRDHQLKYSVSDVNDSQDAVAANSSGTISFQSPANILFPRKIVMEEGTGTWCGWCVRGIETIERLNKQYPDNFIAIGLHTDDEMKNPENYTQIVSQFNSFPGSLINRKKSQDPDYPKVVTLIENMKDLADAKISASATYSKSDNSAVTVSTETVFGYSNDFADYRIAYVVLEDHVGPYVQSNYYSGMGLGNDHYMYEWDQKPGKVKIEFNDVARGIYGGTNGVQGSVPSSVKEGETYHYSYSFNLPKNIQDKKNIRIVTLLIDNNSGEILNADQFKLGDGNDPNPQPQTKVLEFRYEGKALEDNATVVINAEEDSFGFGEMNCETNPSSNPKNGLVLAALGDVKSGTAKLEIISNTLNPGMIQWCMGGECVPMNNRTSLEKSFTANSDGICQVQFDANNVKSEGSLVAKLTATIGKETRVVNINFVYSKASPIDKVEFRYGGKSVENNATVTINAEEDSFGFGELNCETNPSSNPKNGLVFVTPNGVQDGTAKLEILSNTLNPGMVQWCMGGECVPMNSKTELEKTFKTNSEGMVLVQFDANNIRSEGTLEAKLTATIGEETRVVNIKFVYDKTNSISVIYSEDDNAVWYDMNGTRLENAPTRKGVYIRNGKKVVR